MNNDDIAPPDIIVLFVIVYIQGEGLVYLNSGGVMCITCGKIFSSACNCRRHVRESHRPAIEAQCKLCKRVYKSERVRNDHYKNAHGISVKEMLTLERM